ncbi:hypothetical protein [Chitinibacter sp. S2-10]|uniref:hypothetical protein n=1 Tax=Chitinibacter sp. S2-10 TaxID=3373597 RepID=UPI003977B08F
MKLKSVIYLTWLLCGSVSAGEALIQNAIDKQDYVLAFASAKADVDDGSATDVTRLLLAQLYMQGKGTDKNSAAARALLEPLVARKLPEAQFMLAGLLQSEALTGLKMADGQLDLMRYAELAKRDLVAREDERYAAELVYKAAQQHFKLAVEAICLDLGNSVTALGGTERANWYRQCDKENWAKASEMGQSHVPLYLRREVLQHPLVAAAFQNQALKAACTEENIKPIDFKISKPVTGGEYLMLKLDDVKQPKPYKMIRGKWQEVWVAQACGQKFTVPIRFEADGMGKATFAPDLPEDVMAELLETVKAKK